MSSRRVILRSLALEEKIQESRVGVVIEQEKQIESISKEEKIDDISIVAKETENIVEASEEKVKKKPSFKKKKENINTL